VLLAQNVKTHDVITDVITQYAGPDGDFYKKKGHKMKKKWFRIDGDIEIMNGMAVNKTFSNEDYIEF